MSSAMPDQPARPADAGTGGVRRVPADGPWQESVGYSRAVAAGPLVFVSGCTSASGEDVSHVGDPYAQTLAAFAVAEAALAQLGATLADVVQTRLYVNHMRDQAEVGRAHKELFDASRPAATMVEVGAFVDPRMLVEVECIAYLAPG